VPELLAVELGEDAAGLLFAVVSLRQAARASERAISFRNATLNKDRNGLVIYLAAVGSS
jgi:hypothetical protein